MIMSTTVPNFGVTVESVNEVLRIISPEDSFKLINYIVSPATANVQGFSSQILRVNATVQKGCSEDVDQQKTYSYILKRMPADASMLGVISENNIFTQEVEFFDQALPLLEKKCNTLPIVKCFQALPLSITMEDLSQQGYKVLVENMAGIKNNSISYLDMKLIVEKLATYHAASLDYNWYEIMPYLKNDSMLEKPSIPFPTLLKKACEGYSKALKLFYPDIDSKYSKWLLTQNHYDTFLKFVKPSEKFANVLCHGDFWVNNVMMKHKNNEPSDVKFIDFQLCRYAPASIDLHNFLYTCKEKEFRDKFEADFIKIYVESFNRTLGIDKLNIETFKQECEEFKLYGVLIAFTFRSMNLMPDLYPKEGEEMSGEMFEAMISGKHFENLTERCQTDEYLNNTVRELLQEFIQHLKI